LKLVEFGISQKISRS